MAKQATIEITMSWWLRWIYLPCFTFFWAIALTVNPKATVKWESFDKWAGRGMKVKCQ